MGFSLFVIVCNDLIMKADYIHLAQSPKYFTLGCVCVFLRIKPRASRQGAPGHSTAPRTETANTKLMFHRTLEKHQG